MHQETSPSAKARCVVNGNIQQSKPWLLWDLKARRGVGHNLVAVMRETGEVKWRRKERGGHIEGKTPEDQNEMGLH